MASTVPLLPLLYPGQRLTLDEFLRRMREVVEAGINSLEHEEFVLQLEARRG